jgi:DNA invertase Pin-like site-specific DNA recombinase
MSTGLAYIRRSSTPGRGADPVSFDMQEKAVRDLAAAHGDSIAEILSDFARSGGTTKHRPGYARLLEAIDRGQVATIYSYSLSRLSRSLLDFADLLERCRAHSVRIRFVTEGEIDYSTATGRAYANMAATFAQMERELATERNASAVAARIARGDYVGQAPYGKRIAGGSLIPRKDEKAAVVVAAFREAGSFGGAAKLLNARGVPTRHGGTWRHGVVADLLRREAPRDLAVPLAHHRARARPVQDAIFAGLLRCACGSTLTPRREAGALAVRGYYCHASSRLPEHGKMYVAEGPVLEWAKREVARLQVPYDVLEMDEQVSDRRKSLEARRRRIVSAFLDGVLDRAERDRQLATVDAKLTHEASATVLAAIPRTIDWTVPPVVLNGLLRALWEAVELDADMQPVRAIWRVPEWRKP